MKKLNKIWLRYLISRTIEKLKGISAAESEALRKMFSDLHGIDVGMYSYGCFDVKRFPAGTKIGRYCSIAPSVKVCFENHSLKFLSTSATFNKDKYRNELNVENLHKKSRLTISDDVWIGENVTITPRVTSLGLGSIIGAGSVVTQNVEPFTVVAGNPARIVRSRFTMQQSQEITASHWWIEEPDVAFAKLRKMKRMFS